MSTEPENEQQKLARLVEELKAERENQEQEAVAGVGMSDGQKLAAAAGMQEMWQFVLDMLDGQIAEAQRHGWDLSQSRMLVFSTYVNTMLGKLV